MSAFFRARLRLTIWYTLILFVVSALLSSLYYWRSMQIINLQSQRLQDRIQRDLENDALQRRPRMRAEIFETELVKVYQELQQQIVFINLLVLGFGSVASYLLAGKTLRPIETAFSAQRRFVSDAAHELKTPLTALRTAIEVSLLDKKIGKTAQIVLRENLSDIINLQTLTENLLSLAKTQEGVRFERVAVPVASVLTQATKQISAMAKKKQITLSLDDIDSNISVMANEQNLLRVVLILLDNAIKYSPENSKIKIAAKTQNRKGVIVVSDQGRGIPARYHKVIFDRFYRVSAARNRQAEEGGHGLGLAVAKELVEAMGGRILLKSNSDTGSTFSIVLPLT